jgi:cytochrome c-type biogenesis protein
MLELSELFNQFSLGNAAILTNACLLPLYPGLIAFMAGNADDKSSRILSAFLGVLVLSGVLTTMILIGLILYLAQAAFESILPVLLPIIYFLVIAFGASMLWGYNPFNRLAMSQAPMLKNRYITAYVYGLFFGPMTLPCTGPFLTSAFLLGTLEGGSVAVELSYVVAFGLGFGWPLVVLPLVALPVQRRVIGWLTQNHIVLTRASGFLLIAVGVFGVITELLPQYIRDFDVASNTQLLYWTAAFALTLLVAYFSYIQRHKQPESDYSQSRPSTMTE